MNGNGVQRTREGVGRGYCGQNRPPVHTGAVREGHRSTRARDVELVESLGSGIPRILRAYGEDCFKFTDNFIRITLPISAHDHASDHASVQVEKLVFVLIGEMGRSELQELLSIKNRDYFRIDYLNPAINQGYVELTIPDKPNSQNQKYRLTAKGIALKDVLSKVKE